MREDQIRSAARAALTETESRVDTDAAWRALLDDTGTAKPRRRWAPVAGAAAAVAALATTGVLLFDRSDQVRTVEPPATTQAVTVPPTRPSETVTTSPVTPAPATELPSPTQPPTTAPEVPDPFAQATSVAATSDGVLLGLPDASWFPTALTEPATGPAYLVDRWVVQQQSDGFYGVGGDIRVIGPNGMRVWEPPGAATTESGATRYRLLDAGLVDGAPTMLVSDADHDSPETADVRLLRVNIETGVVRDLGSFGGWESGIGGAGIGTTRLAVLRSALTHNWIEVLDQSGTSLFRHDLTPDTNWSLSVVNETAWAFGVRSREANTFVGPQTEYYAEVIEIDLETFEARPTEVFLPGYEDRLEPCSWASYDGFDFTCATYGAPIAAGNGVTRTSPGVTDGIVRSRRGAPRPVAAELLTGYRPYIDPALCTPVTAHSEPGGQTTFWQPFAMGSTPFVTYQFVGYPDVGAGGTFALVAVLETPRVSLDGAWSEPAVDINGLRAQISARDTPAYADAFVDLPDGRQAYVRTHGFTRRLMEQVIGALTPRPVDAAVPGFDYNAALGPPGMELIHEQLPAPWLVGTVHRLRCTQGSVPVPDGSTGEYSLWSIEGGLMYQFLAVLDRPYPLDIGHRDGSVLILVGPDTPGHPTVTDVVEAPIGEWLDLLDEPWPEGMW
ncbi:MAG TPA: hypothetical protein VNQ73_07475 [Ilumatobacter sp.]|nr:hypothetical protein [Ilumatobacter sp.]